MAAQNVGYIIPIAVVRLFVVRACGASLLCADNKLEREAFTGTLEKFVFGIWQICRAVQSARKMHRKEPLFSLAVQCEMHDEPPTSRVRAES